MGKYLAWILNHSERTNSFGGCFVTAEKSFAVSVANESTFTLTNVYNNVAGNYPALAQKESGRRSNDRGYQSVATRIH